MTGVPKAVVLNRRGAGPRLHHPKQTDRLGGKGGSVSPIDPDKFNLEGLDKAALAYKKKERVSQRGEARKLLPQIERLLSQNSEMPTSAVLNALRANYHGGTLPSTTGFLREIGSICGEIRDRLRHGQSARKPAQAKKPKAMPKSTPVMPVSPVGAIATGHYVAPKADRSTVTSSHPLELYAGSFGGLVFKLGPLLRDFFSAVQRGQDDATLKSLAHRAANDAASRVRLPDLHPKDQSIFEAALALP